MKLKQMLGIALQELFTSKKTNMDDKQCFNCDNLDPKKKAAGKVSGNLYYCKKNKTYINPIMKACDKYKLTEKRKEKENEEIKNDGKNYYNDTTPVGLLVAVFIILIILGLALGVFTLD